MVAAAVATDAGPLLREERDKTSLLLLSVDLCVLEISGSVCVPAIMRMRMKNNHTLSELAASVIVSGRREAAHIEYGSLLGD